jgi:hypothetical protein
MLGFGIGEISIEIYSLPSFLPEGQQPRTAVIASSRELVGGYSSTVLSYSSTMYPLAIILRNLYRYIVWRSSEAGRAGLE